MAMTIHSIESLNPLIVQDLGLEFVTNSIKIEGDEKSIYLKPNLALSKTKDMFDFYNENYKFIMDLKEFFDTTTTYPLYFNKYIDSDSFSDITTCPMRWSSLSGNSERYSKNETIDSRNSFRLG
jgi:hypothetical protein